ncbi:hypothetical protein AB0D24_16970 [Streptomyces javensis]|uniref:hypothetical protein n=1 Tax=Streptomyces javensis TaxID=114698 RepID=UPI003403CBC8
MPGTLVKPHARPAEQGVSPLDSVSARVADLTLAERTVALYVSDMPSVRRRFPADQVRAWIVQGAERLGEQELRRWAAFERGHQALTSFGLVPKEVQQRHEERFPKPKRLDWAGQQASNSAAHVPLSEAGHARVFDTEVDGPCPCRGTGSIGFYDWEDGEVDLMCPVHCAAELHAMRWGPRSGRVLSSSGPATSTGTSTTSGDAAQVWAVES